MPAGNAFLVMRVTASLSKSLLYGEEAKLYRDATVSTCCPWPPARIYKRVGNGDTGPNTGGMGAHSRHLVVTDEVDQRTMERIIWPYR
ncbi:hypothetical protein ACNKHQ_23760 [Shigella flexneri]